MRCNRGDPLEFDKCQFGLYRDVVAFSSLFSPRRSSIAELFTAGTDTASNTLEWVMAELLKNPHTLEKAQEELAQVVGRGKLVDGADVAKLPYLKCIIKETFRLHPQVPFFIPCKVEEDVDFSGYFIPKDSQVLVNSWAIGRDSSLWEDPLDFTRERFWESEIDVKGQDFELFPFGAGRRICPVLPLAIRTVPVALSSLLNAFNWKLHGGIVPKDLDMEEDFGITLAKTQPLLAIPIPL
ncbi:Geraniol 8-hydroxylase [Capsicum chinense]|nr:Geraniol 8-hydroxylase [Capsicum chinense]